VLFVGAAISTVHRIIVIPYNLQRLHPLWASAQSYARTTHPFWTTCSRVTKRVLCWLGCAGWVVLAGWVVWLAVLVAAFDPLQGQMLITWLALSFILFPRQWPENCCTQLRGGLDTFIVFKSSTSLRHSILLPYSTQRSTVSDRGTLEVTDSFFPVANPTTLPCCVSTVFRSLKAAPSTFTLYRRSPSDILNCVISIWAVFLRDALSLTICLLRERRPWRAVPKFGKRSKKRMMTTCSSSDYNNPA
jgi:hypothetical protein